MNRSYLRALSGLLRQAAAAAEASALPSSTRFSLPLACLQPVAALASLTAVQTPLLSPTWPRGLSTDAAAPPAAAAVADADADALPDLPGVDDDRIDALLDSPDFKEALDYLHASAGLRRAEATRILLRLTFTGLTEDGRFYYRRSEPLSLSLAGSIRPTVQYLSAVPGIALSRCLRNSPYILLSRRGEQEVWNVRAEWLDDRLGISGSSLGKVLSASCGILRRREEDIEATISALETLGLTPAQVKSMAVRFPQLFSSKAERVREAAAGLGRLGLSTPQIRSVLHKQPSAMALSATKISSIVDWLIRQGLPEGMVGVCLARFPTILSYSIRQNLDPTVAFLREELGLGRESVVWVLTYAPDTLGRSVATLRRHAASAAAAGVDGEDLRTFVRAMPGALRYDLSAEPYASKIRFLQEILGMEPGPALACNPMYITYSMERIAGRAAFLQARGRSTQALTTWLSMPEEKFAEKMAGASLEEWEKFRGVWAAGEEAARWVRATSRGRGRGRGISGDVE